MQQVCKRTQHVTSNNGGRCCPTMLHPFARSINRNIRHFQVVVVQSRKRNVQKTVTCRRVVFANQTFCFFAVRVAVAVVVAKAPQYIIRYRGC